MSMLHDQSVMTKSHSTSKSPSLYQLSCSQELFSLYSYLVLSLRLRSSP